MKHVSHNYLEWCLWKDFKVSTESCSCYLLVFIVSKHHKLRSNKAIAKLILMFFIFDFAENKKIVEFDI